MRHYDIFVCSYSKTFRRGFAYLNGAIVTFVFFENEIKTKYCSSFIFLRHNLAGIFFSDFLIGFIAFLSKIVLVLNDFFFVMHCIKLDTSKCIQYIFFYILLIGLASELYRLTSYVSAPLKINTVLISFSTVQNACQYKLNLVNVYSLIVLILEHK